MSGREQVGFNAALRAARSHAHSSLVCDPHREGDESDRAAGGGGGLLDDPQAVYPGGGEWETIRPWLDRVSLAELSKETGISERRLREYRQGKRRPKAERTEVIAEALARLHRK